MTDVAVEPAKKSKKLLLIVAAVVALAGGGGAFVLLTGEAGAEEAAEAPPEEGAVVAVADLTANLAGAEVHYAKVGFSAILAVGADEAAVTARFALLRDAAISELSTFEAAHLRSTAGMDELRNRLTARAQEVYPDGEVVRVVLTELLVQ
jgi:flagellar protein FliL